MFRHFFAHTGHSRFFERGDLKYVILDLLKSKPSHGYEIMRALEERYQGFYAPSAGSVYPTLQLLEDMGYVTSVQKDGKKVYAITDEGKRFIADQEEALHRIRDHMHGFWGMHEGKQFRDTFKEISDIAHLVGRRAHRLDAGKMARIREIIKKACQDIEKVVEEE